MQGIGLEYEAVERAAGPVTIIPVEPPVAEAAPAAAPTAETGWALKAEDGQTRPIKEGVTKIGRGEGNDLQLDELKVSRFHAELKAAGEGLEVTDLGSTNGTLVNGERLAPREARSLNPGDEVCFGAAKFTCAK